MRADNTGAAIDLGATDVNNGGGTVFTTGGGQVLLLPLDAPLFALLTDAASSFNRAISENTCANGWY